MSYELEIRCEPNWLHVQVTGIQSIPTLMAIGKDCLKACAKHDYKKLLVDVQRMTGKLGDFEAFDIGSKELGKVEGLRLVKTAVVELEENRDRFEFLNTVLHNRGFNIQTFSNAADAERWLGES